MKGPFLYILLLLTFSALAQAPRGSSGPARFRPVETTAYYQLGDKRLPIRIFHYGTETGLLMINLHDNETTSVKAARTWLEQNGGTLIKFENDKKRTIRFRFKGQPYEFDPNRIFSREGITASLRETGRMTADAVNEVEKFAARILQLIPERTDCIIALHNNTEGLFSVSSYLPGHERQMDARMVTEHPDQDPDDIFLTTDSLLYAQLAGQGYNTILQDNETVRRDGSLSVFCGEKGWRYLNCETQHGKVDQYERMITAAGTTLLGGIPGGLLYEYTIKADVAKPAKGQDIWFGDKRIGVVLSAPAASGRLILDPSFQLYSNMDLFYYQAKDRLELQIDPTRERRLLERTSARPEIITR